VLEYTRRLVFAVLIGNADAHLKNWSLMYPDGRTPKLAPAYDLVGTIPYIPADRLALSLADTKVFGEVDLKRFRRYAEKAGLPVRLVVQTARETAERVRDLWRGHEPLRAMPAFLKAKPAAPRMQTAMTTMFVTVRKPVMCPPIAASPELRWIATTTMSAPPTAAIP